MRLITQNGLADAPYEFSALSVGRNFENYVIYVRSKLFEEKPCLFATYSTEEKAKKVMEMVQKEYLCYTTNNLGTAFNQPKVFKFPLDEEIEVVD